MSRPKRGTRNGKKAPKLKQARVDHQGKQPASTNDSGGDAKEKQGSDTTVPDYSHEGTGDEDTWKRLADDLVVVRKISLLDALLGCRLLIRHPEGRKLLVRTQRGQITKPEAFFRVRGGGFKRQGQQLSNDNNKDHRRLTGGLRGIGGVDKKCFPWGDLLLGVKVMFPPDFFLSDRARYEHLASLLRPAVDDPYGGRLLNFNDDEGSKSASTAAIKKEVELSYYDPTRYAPRMEEDERVYPRGVPPGVCTYTPPPGCNIQ